MPLPDAFDPDAPAAADSGLFGAEVPPDQASVVLIPVPFEATVSFGPGTAEAPEAIRVASTQVDLNDPRFGPVYQRGLALDPLHEPIRQWSRQASELARPHIAAGRPIQPQLARHIDDLCARVNAYVESRAAAILAHDRIPGLIGGEHGVSLGAIRACAAAHGPIGLLQIDAHLDLRPAYFNLSFSHASIMHNVLDAVPDVRRLVQVGARDFGLAEQAAAHADPERVRIFYDARIADHLAAGRPFADLVDQIVHDLPHRVYVSFDIDGLDPSLCPHTGTPVPGGLTFHQAAILLHALHRSGRDVVGFDLVEVVPGPDPLQSWDANVAARVLYMLCGLAGTARNRNRH